MPDRMRTSDGEPRGLLRRPIVLLVAVAVIAVVAAVIVWPDSAPPDSAPPISAPVIPDRPCSATNAADPQMSEPTGGDLSGDTRFCGEVLHVWEQNLTKGTTDGILLSDLVAGQPHVFWAGSTSAGRVAVVKQAMKSESAGIPPAVGIVGIVPGSNRLAVLAADAPGHRAPEEIGYRLGPEGRTVLILDRGIPLYVPSGHAEPYEFDPRTGTVKRTWRQLTVSDGVALGGLPVGSGINVAAILGDPQDAEPADMIPLVETKTPSDTRPDGLGWGNGAADPQQTWMASAGIDRDGWQDEALTHDRFFTAVRNSPLIDPFAPSPRGLNSWYLTVGLPNGKTAIISEYHPGRNGPARIFAVVDNGDGVPPMVIHGGLAGSRFELPVLIEMPDRQGWVAANRGREISFQTAKNAEWQDKQNSAVLLPPDATKVQVFTAGHAGPANVSIPTK